MVTTFKTNSDITLYNQDFSKRAILIEIGGYENTPSEVLNSVLAFSECFMEVISKDES